MCRGGLASKPAYLQISSLNPPKPASAIACMGRVYEYYWYEYQQFFQPAPTHLLVFIVHIVHNPNQNLKIIGVIDCWQD